MKKHDITTWKVFKNINEIDLWKAYIQARPIKAEMYNQWPEQ